MSAESPEALTDESAEWLNMEDFASGIDTNRIPASHDLVGSDLAIRTPAGEELRLSFTSPDRLEWSGEGFDWAGTGVEAYEEVPVGDGAYWIDFSLHERRVETLTVVLHPQRGWALIVHSRIHEEGAPVETRVGQTFHGGAVDGIAARIPEPTRDLIGKRTLFRYSPHHLYEHIYLSSRRFTWHNLVGEQRGHAATELATTYKLDDGLYLFTWREQIIPVGTVFVFDYANGRSTGKFIGLEGDGTIANSAGGALIIPFGESDYSLYQLPV